jgi:hypothetical protein
MAEDSGAFKTNRANSLWVPAFVMIPECRCREASVVPKLSAEHERDIHRGEF